MDRNYILGIVLQGTLLHYSLNQ